VGGERPTWLSCKPDKGATLFFTSLDDPPVLAYDNPANEGRRVYLVSHQEFSPGLSRVDPHYSTYQVRVFILSHSSWTSFLLYNFPPSFKGKGGISYFLLWHFGFTVYNPQSLHVSRELSLQSSVARFGRPTCALSGITQVILPSIEHSMPHSCFGPRKRYSLTNKPRGNPLALAVSISHGRITEVIPRSTYAYEWVRLSIHKTTIDPTSLAVTRGNIVVSSSTAEQYA